MSPVSVDDGRPFFPERNPNRLCRPILPVWPGLPRQAGVLEDPRFGQE